MPSVRPRTLACLGLAATAFASGLDGRAPEPRFRNSPTAILEREANDSPATATPLPAGGFPVVVGYGAIAAEGDQDYWTFVACNGCRFYAWVDTGGVSYGNTRDSALDLYAPDGTTLLETDAGDGIGTGGDFTIESFSASLIAGRTLAAGRHYLRVREATGFRLLNPYRLHVALIGIGGSESEPNDSAATADEHPLFAAVSGTLASDTDIDYFNVELANRHEQLCAFVDADPDRNGTSTPLTLQIRDGNDALLLTIVSSSGTPDSHAEGACFTPTAGNQRFRVAPHPATSGNYTIFIVPGRAASLSRTEFDRDFRQDLVVWRPSTGAWHILFSLGGWTVPFAIQWGMSGDVPVAADYDGDGVTDAAVFRPSTGVWYVRRSTNPGTPLALQWGQNGDLPRPGDVDGDGLADPIVFRPSTGQWFALKSTTNYATSLTVTWGMSGDVPVLADHDGDGLADFAVWRPSTGAWYRLGSGRGYAPMPSGTFGMSGDIPVLVAHSLGTQPGVFRPSNGQWYGPISEQWGTSGDVPAPGHYDRDTSVDAAVWRPSTGVWYVQRSNPISTVTRQWGQNGDVPIRDSY